MPPKAIIGTQGTSGWPEFAGSSWVRLQYVLGLQRLGFETYWVDRLPEVDPLKQGRSIDYLMPRFHGMATDFGFENQYCVVYKNGERYFGLDQKEFLQLCNDAALLINISGHLTDSSPLMNVPKRAYVEVDPGFTQIWAHEWDMGFGLHNYFFTTGQNVGGPGFTIPLQGVDWRPILPPIVLEQWLANIDEGCRRFTTVADWRGSQNAELEGEQYGGKRDEFLRFLEVPIISNQRIDLALCIGQHDHADLGLLLDHNWRVRDPYSSAGDPFSYREFIRYSRAEFSVAKGGYVKSKSGWVSDRTGCYLASGKPALVQATGFESRIPTGKGLLTFSTVEEAVEGIASINSDYLAHCRAARRLAEEYFDSDVVLGGMLEAMGL